MAVETLVPSILKHLFKNGGIGPELNDEILESAHVESADRLANKQSVTFTGDTTGSFSFDGSAAVSTALATGNATKWDGATKYVSTNSATGGSNGDIWFQYIS